MTDEKAELKREVQELRAEIRNLEHDLIHDPLTGLKTRAFFEDEINTYLEAIAENNKGKRREWFGFRNISIAFFDIDHFKKVNDTEGHASGDAVLKTVAGVLRKSIRSGDTAARWGGEEMVVSLLGANEADAKVKADEIRKTIEETIFEEVPGLKVTISCGVATGTAGLKLSELVERADEALYSAKDGGRNKVVAYSDLEQS